MTVLMSRKTLKSDNSSTKITSKCNYVGNLTGIYDVDFLVKPSYLLETTRLDAMVNDSKRSKEQNQYLRV
jgi:hypothetical protein